MNISQIILMLMNSANTLEREVVCNDDFDGNEDVTDAIEDIRNVAKALKTMTGVDYKSKAKREEHIRGIEAVLKTNIPNKEFQYFFAFTTSKEDSIHCYGCSDYVFDVNTGTEIIKRAARCVKNPEELIHAILFAIMEDDDD